MNRLGSFDLLLRLGARGHARAYLARDMLTAPPSLALIKLHDGPEAEPSARLFETEGRLAQLLVHPGIPRFLRAEWAGRTRVLAFQYVPGLSLQDVLREARRDRSPVSVATLLLVVRAVLDALDYAHRLRADGRPLGLVHRDVSPANILIPLRSHARLLDFGNAKGRHRDIETEPGLVKGTYAYLSPEQAEGRPLTPASDVFSLGVVLWEALTGRPLFRASAALEALEAVRHTPIIAPSLAAPGISAAVDPIVLKALDRDPRTRYHTAAEMRADVDGLLDRAGVAIETSYLEADLFRIFGTRIGRIEAALRSAQLERTKVLELARELGAQAVQMDELGAVTPIAPTPTPAYEPL